MELIGNENFFGEGINRTNDLWTRRGVLGACMWQELIRESTMEYCWRRQLIKLVACDQEKKFVRLVCLICSLGYSRRYLELCSSHKSLQLFGSRIVTPNIKIAFDLIGMSTITCGDCFKLLLILIRMNIKLFFDDFVFVHERKLLIYAH